MHNSCTGTIFLLSVVILDVAISLLSPVFFVCVCVSCLLMTVLVVVRCSCIDISLYTSLVTLLSF
jgi:hypothetical protein